MYKYISHLTIYYLHIKIRKICIICTDSFTKPCVLLSKCSTIDNNCWPLVSGIVRCFGILLLQLQSIFLSKSYVHLDCLVKNNVIKCLNDMYIKHKNGRKYFDRLNEKSANIYSKYTIIRVQLRWVRLLYKCHLFCYTVHLFFTLIHVI